MKTLKNGNEIVRVSEKDVKSYLNRGYNFTSKTDWKENVRGYKSKKKTTDEVEPTTDVSSEPIQKPKKSKKQ